MGTRLTHDAKKFVIEHEVAVLSTLSHDRKVHGATVYYRYMDGDFYIITKSGSNKAHNMLAHHQVALTIFDSDEIKTIQLQGKAHIESDMKTKRLIFEEIVHPRPYKGEHLMPPVSQLSAGGFITFRITPTNIFYMDYKDESKIIRSHTSHFH